MVATFFLTAGWRRLSPAVAANEIHIIKCNPPPQQGTTHTLHSMCHLGRMQPNTIELQCQAGRGKQRITHIAPIEPGQNKNVTPLQKDNEQQEPCPHHKICRTRLRHGKETGRLQCTRQSRKVFAAISRVAGCRHVSPTTRAFVAGRRRQPATRATTGGKIINCKQRTLTTKKLNMIWT